ncbi:MAG: signal peptidase I [Coriobacteriia bacterium]|nr:signal peptidase I [Coriobacteriia bacterium]
MPEHGRTPAEAPAPDEGAGRFAVSGAPAEADPATLADPGAQRARQRAEVRAFARWLAEMAIIVVISLISAWAIKTWLVQPFEIPSTSMEPTLLVGDRVLVDKLAYRSRTPAPGDVVVFTSAEDPSKNLIKRVVAVGGQTLDIEDGRLIVDGDSLTESYVNATFPDDYTAEEPTTVPAGMIYVMGDNRASSRDSRFFGPVPLTGVLGRAFAIYWPPARIGGL